jgi:hypothetical protein
VVIVLQAASAVYNYQLLSTPPQQRHIKKNMRISSSSIQKAMRPATLFAE